MCLATAYPRNNYLFRYIRSVYKEKLQFLAPYPQPLTLSLQRLMGTNTT